MGPNTGTRIRRAGPPSDRSPGTERRGPGAEGTKWLFSENRFCYLSPADVARIGLFLILIASRIPPAQGVFALRALAAQLK